MSAHLQVIGRIFTIYIMTCVINGLLCGSYLYVADGLFYDNWFASVVVVLTGSLFFSLPGHIIFWFVLSILVSKHIYDRGLFRAALATAFVLACITTFILFRTVYSKEIWLLDLFAITSSITSVMLHFRSFLKIKPAKDNYQIN